MVKPNILTHVIEGYVIQEAGEPFAVSVALNCYLYYITLVRADLIFRAVIE